MADERDPGDEQEDRPRQPTSAFAELERWVMRDPKMRGRVLQRALEIYGQPK